MSNDGTAVIQHDPYLAPYASFFRARYSSLQLLLKEINLKEGSLEQFTSAYKRMGFSVNEKGITFREYAPAAKAISLIGDFNNWDRSHTNYNLTKRDFGMWDIFLPRNEDGSLPIPHDSKIKLSMIIEDGRKVDRIPVWIRRVVQELDTANFDGIFWWPNEEYQWKFDQNRPIIKTFDYSLPRGDPRLNNGNNHNENDNISNLIKNDQLTLPPLPSSSSPPSSPSSSRDSNLRNSSSPSSSSSSSLLLSPSPFLSQPMMEKRSKEDFEEEEKRKTNIVKDFERLRIYEAHIGMSSEQPIISTYKKFKEEVLPHVYKLGYNCIQLMGIMEHSYYASFGYQVTNLFAVSSRYGSPDDLKELIDEAHRLNIIVLLDVVHSHVSKNVDDGINQFDGTTYCYFHEGERGYHPLWDSRLYNYRHWEVLRLLLSNLRFYIEEFHFDGFRFDGVTSMLYQHHGLSQSFAGGYDDYFSDSIIDHDAALYLTLANELLHSFYKNIITIAEDVSGFPSLCRPVGEGGMGFDYRLAMAIPDLWIKLLKEFKDEDWPLGHICYTLINRRHLEKSIAYAESHDQSLVGDKTIAFWLMDKYMYTDMSTLFSLHPIIDRGISLHKLIRLITYSLGGEGYLNFMGNEFGHPEWIDFPRAGNNNSCFYARRQWSLVKDPLLRYQYLYNFDCAMHSLEKLSKWLSSEQAYISHCDDNQKVTIFERGNLLWAFNFHPTESYVNFRIPVKVAGKYKIILDSDDARFGGHNRIDRSIEFFTDPFSYSHFNNSMLTYLPSRCAIVWYNTDLFSYSPL